MSAIEFHHQGDRWTVDTSALPLQDRIKLSKAIQLALVENNCQSGTHRLLPDFKGFEATNPPAILIDALKGVIARWNKRHNLQAEAVTMPTVTRWQQWKQKFWPGDVRRRTQIHIAPDLTCKKALIGSKFSFWIRFSCTKHEMRFVAELSDAISKSPSLRGLKWRWRYDTLTFTHRRKDVARHAYNLATALRGVDYYGDAPAVPFWALRLSWVFCSA